MWWLPVKNTRLFICVRGAAAAVCLPTAGICFHFCGCTKCYLCTYVRTRDVSVCCVRHRNADAVLVSVNFIFVVRRFNEGGGGRKILNQFLFAASNKICNEKEYFTTIFRTHHRLMYSLHKKYLMSIKQTYFLKIFNIPKKTLRC